MVWTERERERDNRETAVGVTCGYTDSVPSEYVGVHPGSWQEVHHRQPQPGAQVRHQPVARLGNLRNTQAILRILAILAKEAKLSILSSSLYCEYQQY